MCDILKNKGIDEKRAIVLYKKNELLLETKL